MLALPLARPAVGVKVAVRVNPVPLIAPKLPLLTTTSPNTKLLPGSSLKVKVIAAVSPAFSVDLSLVIVKLGGVVSVTTIVL